MIVSSARVCRPNLVDLIPKSLIPRKKKRRSEEVGGDDVGDDFEVLMVEATAVGL